MKQAAQGPIWNCLSAWRNNWKARKNLEAIIDSNSFSIEIRNLLKSNMSCKNYLQNIQKNAYHSKKMNIKAGSSVRKQNSAIEMTERKELPAFMKRALQTQEKESELQ